MRDVELFDIANKICAEHGHTLVYLMHFGSRLYGTSSENSDTDVKGVFIPNKDEMLMGNHCKHLNWNTGTCKGKNTKDDIDMQLWSLQYWIHLISIGIPMRLIFCSPSRIWNVWYSPESLTLFLRIHTAVLTYFSVRSQHPIGLS